MNAKFKKGVPTFFRCGLFSKTQKHAKNAFFWENCISARNGKVFLGKFRKQTQIKIKRIHIMTKKISSVGCSTKKLGFIEEMIILVNFESFSVFM
jgi:hypothetical protein